MVTPLHEAIIGNSRAALTILFAATCALLLVACANVGNALLARLLTRRRELAIRAAAGASTLRLLQQLGIESFVLVTAGGVGALAFSNLALWTLRKIGMGFLPRSSTVRFDGPALVAALCLVFLVTVAITGIMAASLSRLGLSALMTTRGASAVGRSVSVRDVFVVGQLSLALVLGIDAWLLVSGLLRLQAVSLGFNPASVTVAAVSFPSSRYSTTASRTAFFDAAVSSISNLGIASAVAYTSRIPFAAAGITTAITIAGDGSVD